MEKCRENDRTVMGGKDFFIRNNILTITSSVIEQWQGMRLDNKQVETSLCMVRVNEVKRTYVKGKWEELSEKGRHEWMQ